jgi:hypothetical protein
MSHTASTPRASLPWSASDSLGYAVWNRFRSVGATPTGGIAVSGGSMTAIHERHQSFVDGLATRPFGTTPRRVEDARVFRFALGRMRPAIWRGLSDTDAGEWHELGTQDAADDQAVPVGLVARRPTPAAGSPVPRALFGSARGTDEIQPRGQMAIIAAPVMPDLVHGSTVLSGSLVSLASRTLLGRAPSPLSSVARTSFGTSEIQQLHSTELLPLQSASTGTVTYLSGMTESTATRTLRTSERPHIVPAIPVSAAINAPPVIAVEGTISLTGSDPAQGAAADDSTIDQPRPQVRNSIAPPAATVAAPGPMALTSHAVSHRDALTPAPLQASRFPFVSSRIVPSLPALPTTGFVLTEPSGDLRRTAATLLQAANIGPLRLPRIRGSAATRTIATHVVAAPGTDNGGTHIATLSGATDSGGTHVVTSSDETRNGGTNAVTSAGATGNGGRSVVTPGGAVEMTMTDTASSSRGYRRATIDTAFAEGAIARVFMNTPTSPGLAVSGEAGRGALIRPNSAVAVADILAFGTEPVFREQLGFRRQAGDRTGSTPGILVGRSLARAVWIALSQAGPSTATTVPGAPVPIAPNFLSRADAPVAGPTVSLLAAESSGINRLALSRPDGLTKAVTAPARSFATTTLLSSTMEVAALSPRDGTSKHPDLAFALPGGRDESEPGAGYDAPARPLGERPSFSGPGDPTSAHPAHDRTHTNQRPIDSRPPTIDGDAALQAVSPADTPVLIHRSALVQTFPDPADANAEPYLTRRAAMPLSDYAMTIFPTTDPIHMTSAMGVPRSYPSLSNAPGLSIGSYETMGPHPHEQGQPPGFQHSDRQPVLRSRRSAPGDWSDGVATGIATSVRTDEDASISTIQLRPEHSPMRQRSVAMQQRAVPVHRSTIFQPTMQPVTGRSVSFFNVLRLADAPGGSAITDSSGLAVHRPTDAERASGSDQSSTNTQREWARTDLPLTRAVRRAPSPATPVQAVRSQVSETMPLQVASAHGHQSQVEASLMSPLASLSQPPMPTQVAQSRAQQPESVDLDDIVERVLPALMLRLTIEHERRGFGRWS